MIPDYVNVWMGDWLWLPLTVLGVFVGLTLLAAFVEFVRRGR